MLMRRYYSPFEEIEAVRNQINRIFEPLSQEVSESRSTSWHRIPLELKETPTHYRLRAFVPGVDPEKLEVQATGNRLTLSAEINAQESRENEAVLLQEACYGQFKRTLEFAEPIVSGKIEARLEHGVLSLEIPKEKAAQDQPIKVNVKF